MDTKEPKKEALPSPSGTLLKKKTDSAKAGNTVPVDSEKPEQSGHALSNLCPDCEGNGWYMFPSPAKPSEPEQRQCERCLGTGTEEAFLPCPFCGGEPAFATVNYSEGTVKEQGWKQHLFHYVNCVSCGATNQGLVGFESQDVARRAWNQRVPGSGAVTDAAPTDDVSNEEPTTKLVVNSSKLVVGDLSVPNMKRGEKK